MSRPTRVAVVRGDALNPFELQVFGHLDGVEVVAIGRRSPGYEVDLIGVRTELLAPARADSRAARVARRAGLPVERWLGAEGTLQGLEEALDGVDLVHAAETFIPLSEQAAEAAAAKGVPLVLTCWENIPFLHDDAGATTARKARLREQAAVLVAVTPPARDALVAEGVAPERIRVVPAALDLARFEPGHDPAFLRSLTGIPEGDRVVLYVGRLIREKGITELVRAFATLPGDPRAHLVVVGNGPEGGRIRTAATALGLADRVHVLPGQSYADIPSVFRGADVVAIPSLSTPYWQEQFGFVLAEAMACGRPVVTTRSGSIPHVVGDAALLVDDYDVPSLAAALAGLLADPARAAALGAAGRARVEEHYTASTVAPQLEAVYREALRG